MLDLGQWNITELFDRFPDDSPGIPDSFGTLITVHSRRSNDSQPGTFYSCSSKDYLRMMFTVLWKLEIYRAFRNIKY